jgi:hypothetical protein
VSTMVACTSKRGQGATVLSPLFDSPEGVRVSVTFSPRRSSMPLPRLQAAPVLNSRRPGIPLIKALCSSRNGRRNCSSCMPPLRVLPPNSHQTFIGESRGPRDTWRLSRLRASIQFINASMPVDGGCLAQPPPVQSRPTVSSKPFHQEHCDPVTLQPPQRGIRLDTSPSFS